MASLRERIAEILNESAISPTDQIGGQNRTALKVNKADKEFAYRRENKIRMRKERAKERSSQQNKDKNQSEVTIDPRGTMIGSFRLTLKETFLKHLVEYLNTKKSHCIMECISLMEEYPKLKEWVEHHSKKNLPQRSFSVYAARESCMNEQVGSTATRSGQNPHNWTLSPEAIKKSSGHMISGYIMEAHVLPKHALLYIPAFCSEIEKLILSGKIEEPETNIVREAKQRNEVILPHNIDTGLIVETF